MKENILSKIYWGNTVADYLWSLGIVIAGTAVLIIIGLIIGKRIKNLESEDRSRSTAMLRLFQKIVLPFLFLGVLAYALSLLEFEATVMNIVNGTFTAIITFVVIRSINKTIEISFVKYFAMKGSRSDGEESGGLQEKSVRPLLALVKFILWIVGAIFLLANLGFDVTAAIAGLGVSGIAVAIAAQGILGDLFNYFVILLDKPFELGDFILFDDKVGSVEKIGVKTTKLRTLQGELLSVANSDLTSSRIHNMKRMQKRRASVAVGVTYQTSEEQVKAIPGMIREIIESVDIIDGVECDRAHFKSMGAFSLDFEAVYYIPVPDYGVYMDVQQDILQRIYETFNAKKIEFAYPTQTLFLDSEQIKRI